MSSSPSPAPQRSTLVSVLAWLMIVGSGLGLLVSTLQNILFMTVLPADAFAQLAQEGQPPLPPFAQFLFSHFIWFLRGFWLLQLCALVTGVGLLRRMGWARVAVIALLALGVVGNLAGVLLQQSMMSMMIPPPDAPPEFADMFTRMATMIRTAALVFSVAFSALFIWLIARLMSAPIKAEFGADS